ncbi:DUF6701 domain-containing protein [Teredinibacter waterburyi]|uniref:DUF6701 domain-containing protein n=1 Tax=Teredinibacter waterburyi TaxID=1500538 RepID=UPI00165ED910|nr:DUF6701 domain-containing protein [Teredinibacter waterburyi]
MRCGLTIFNVVKQSKKSVFVRDVIFLRFLVLLASVSLKFFVVFLGLLGAENLYAQSCSEVFSDGASGVGTGSSVTLNGGSYIYNSPDNVLNTGGITYNGDPSSNVVCDGVACGQDSPVSAGLTWTSFPGGSYISASTATYTLAPGDYGGFAYYYSYGILYLSPGTYTFSGDFTMGYETDLVITSPGTVRIYVSGNVSFQNYNQVNYGSTGRYLSVYSGGNFTLGTGGRFQGITYSKSGLTLSNDTIYRGAVSSEGNITLNYGTSLYFDEPSVSGGDFSEVCSVGGSPAIDHFVIDVGSGSGSTCVPSEITISVEDATNTVLTDYTGTIDITTSSANGDWSKTATAADALGDLTPGSGDSGAATYSFDASEADAGVISLNLANSHAESLTITLSDSAAGVTTTSTTLSFSENAFVVTATDSLGDDVVAGRDHDFLVQMMREDPTTGACSPASEYDQSSVKVWLTRAASDPNGAAPVVTNATSSASVSLPNTVPASNNFTLPFIDGEASFSLETSDVGRYRIEFLDDSSGFSSSDITGFSNTFVTRPFGFYLQVTGNPAATSATEAVFTSAGTNFSVTAVAVGWQTGDDANNDGVADGHNDTDPASRANLADNSSLPSYGQESPAETLQLSASLIAPSGGVSAGLEDGDASAADGRSLTTFTSGSASTSNVYFNEVGIIEISGVVGDGDYLDTGTSFTARSQGRSGYVGRFTPAYFAIDSASVDAACVLGGFNYLGEQFGVSFNVSAYSSRNTITQNYNAAFARFSPVDSLGSEDYGAIDAAVPTALTSRLFGISSSYNWAAGVGSVVTTAALARTTGPDGPFTQVNLGVSLSDADSVSLRTSDFDIDTDNDSTLDKVLLGQSEFIYGRLRLSDAFGPETAELPVAFYTEEWNGSYWTQHQADSCTEIVRSAVTYPSGTIDIDGNRTVPLGSASTTGNYSGLTATTITFDSGDAGHFFSAPNSATGSFSVEVDLSAYPWLQFDWDGDGSDEASLPTATFTFGSYRGHDRVIYWQEVLN